MLEKIKDLILSRDELIIPSYDEDTGHVYVLYNSIGRAAYVGQSMHVFSRLSYHCNRWNLSLMKCEFYTIKAKDLLFVEDYLIKILKPYLNDTRKSIFPKKPPRKQGELSLFQYLKKNNITISDFSKKIGYSRTGIQGYLNGYVRLGKKAALAIEEETKGIVPSHRVLNDNPPKKEDFENIMKQSNLIMDSRKKKDHFEQFELPLGEQ